MPFEIVLIVLFSITAGITGFITVTKIIVNHLDRRRGTTGGSSLSHSELRALITDAVQEATLPLEEKISVLQRQLGPGEPGSLPAEHDPGQTDS